MFNGLRLMVAVLLCLCFSFTNASAVDVNVTYISYDYEASLDGANIIGVMPRVDLYATDNNGNPVSNVQVCVQWYRGVELAMPPNVDIPMGEYCRDTEADGSTFFAFRNRFAHWYPIDTWDESLEDISNLDLRLYITTLSQFIDITL